MPISSYIDVILDTDDILVLGPPNSIDVQVDIGPQGERGNRFFVGTNNPNTLTSVQFESAYGLLPIENDLFLRQNDSNFAIFYRYTSSNTWEQAINLYALSTTAIDALMNAGYNSVGPDPSNDQSILAQRVFR
jgi:hypothetical protein